MRRATTSVGARATGGREAGPSARAGFSGGLGLAAIATIAAIAGCGQKGSLVMPSAAAASAAASSPRSAPFSASAPL